MIGSAPFPRVQVLPQVDRASFVKDGLERVGYVYGAAAPRPFLFPVIGPSGSALTRLGHPDPTGHPHHRSIWFGHQSVSGVNFWEERPGTDTRIIHRRVRLFHDRADWAGMVAELDWWSRGVAVIRQELTLVFEPGPDATDHLDLQSRFEVPAGGGVVELGRTNFGFLGVRVAKTMSEQFGGGRLTSGEGQAGEAGIFGKRSRWIDDSGPVAPGKTDGICFMDHPGNPRFPSHWHVRRDGWMGAAFNLAESYGLARDHPLELRYRLLLHPGPADAVALDRAWERFAGTPAYRIVPGRGQELAALVR
jgi:hypothetical protein